MEPGRHPHSLSKTSFYHFPKITKKQACQGMACFVARHLDPAKYESALESKYAVNCLGKCFLAPACGGDEARPRIEARCQTPVLLARVLKGGAHDLKSYLQAGGFAGLKRALFEGADFVLDELDASQLRGRGGAGFPAGKKWRAVAEQPAGTKYIVANADEGDPGAYIDRYLMEDDPFCLIEAMTIAGFAVGAKRGYIYLRAEYPHAYEALQAALREAREAGWLGSSIDHTTFGFDIDIFVGHGSYVCGEETALLNSIEGRRPEVRTRPPYPTEAGLYGKPTLVNNVETFASVPWIVREGGAKYSAMGFSKSRGTKLLSLNSLFNRPGLYEVEFGIPVRKIVEEIGGGLRGGTLRGVVIGGPLAGIIPPELLDTRFGFEELRVIGASVGHGAVVAFDEHTSIAELMHHVFRFGAFESCGKCTPCREGGARVASLLERVAAGGELAAEEEQEMNSILTALAETSVCGLGTGMADFARSALRYYAEELKPCYA